MTPALRRLLKLAYPAIYPAFALTHATVLTPFNRWRNRTRSPRQLEIGPGGQPIDGFETLGIVATPSLDYLWNASTRLPFSDDTFDLIYASHVLEHVPWYQVQPSLNEWVRVLRKGGAIEIWVPNGLAIADAFVRAESGQASEIHRDGWYKFNDEKDPCVWANGRVFSYGDGTGRKSSPNWHMSLFSPRYLALAMQRSGLTDVSPLPSGTSRGYDHGWINLGMRGRKP